MRSAFRALRISVTIVARLFAALPLTLLYLIAARVGADRLVRWLDSVLERLLDLDWTEPDRS